MDFKVICPQKLLFVTNKTAFYRSMYLLIATGINTMTLSLDATYQSFSCELSVP